MPITGYCGHLGAGKTAALTWQAYEWQRAGNTVYSNYKLNFPYEPIIDYEDIEDMTGGFAALDEIWLWLDSRLSITKRNRAISDILLKSRKRRINIGYTAQSFRQVDVRLRNVTDYLGQPELRGNKKWLILKYFHNPPGKPVMIRKLKTNKIFKLYDTREEISRIDYAKKE